MSGYMGLGLVPITAFSAWLITATYYNRKNRINAELLDALKVVIPYMESAEDAGLIGHEGCHWPVEIVRDAIARAEAA